MLGAAFCKNEGNNFFQWQGTSHSAQSTSQQANTCSESTKK